MSGYRVAFCQDFVKYHGGPYPLHLDLDMKPKKPIELAKDWFSLDCYERLESFGSVQWAQQIAKRADILSAIKKSSFGVLDAEVLVEDLINAPLSDYSFSYTTTGIDAKGQPRWRGTVVPFGFSDLDRFAQLRDHFSEVAEGPVDDWAHKLQDLKALASFGHFKVDLTARDEDILQDFKGWLALRRAEGNGLSSLSYRNSLKKDMTAWQEARLLPYFDLTTWSCWRRIRLPQKDIVELLFPDDPAKTRDSLRALAKNSSAVITYINAIALATLGA